MCGRYVRSSPVSKFAELFNAQGGFDLKPSYNVAPSQAALVAREVDGRRDLDLLHWGLIPFWAKEKKAG